LGTWVVVGHLKTTNDVYLYKRHAALLAELMRVPAWCVLGWYCYRWVESGQRTVAGLASIALTLALLVACFMANKDGGPVLAQALCVALVLAGMLRSWLVVTRTRGSLRISQKWMDAGVGLIAIALVAGILAGGYWMAPADRKAVSVLAGKSDYLAIVYWLLDITPLSGMGLGNVPWCGYEAIETRVVCSRAQGVSPQIQSDYVGLMLLAIWGWPAALAIIAGLIAWLCVLPRRRTLQQGTALNLDLLRQWMLIGFAMTYTIQILLSLTGTLGFLPMTGLTIPLLSWGGTGLLTASIFVGLAVHGIVSKCAKNANTSPVDAGAATAATHVMQMFKNAALVLVLLAAVLLAIAKLNTADNAKHSHHVHGVDQTGNTLSRMNPWLLLEGCLLFSDGKPYFDCSLSRQKAHTLLSQDPLYPALQGMQAWRSPAQASKAWPTQQAQPKGQNAPHGADTRLTLDSDWQGIATRLGHCMTGQGVPAQCSALGIKPDQWSAYVEGAAARSIGAVLVDIRTGEIKSLISTHSACYAKQHGANKDEAATKDCPLPPFESIQTPSQGQVSGRLAHHALFDAVMPGSWVKMVMVLGLLRDPVLGPQLRMEGSKAQADLLAAIRTSSTPYFLDKAFCQDLGFKACNRLQKIADSAQDLGLNQAAPPLYTAQSGDQAVNFTRGLVMPAMLYQTPLVFESALAAECAKPTKTPANPKGDRWSKCRGPQLAKVSAELWGQGDALTTPINVAGMMSRIGAAANGWSDVITPHLVRSIEGKLDSLESVSVAATLQKSPVTIPTRDAQLLLRGMHQTHSSAPKSTARSSCIAAQLPCDQLKGVAGKTSTPVFNHERMTWQVRRAFCLKVQSESLVAQNAKAVAGIELPLAKQQALQSNYAACTHRPIKSYAALLRADPYSSTGPYTHALVVTTERNYKTTGYIDSQEDLGPNAGGGFVFRLIANVFKAKGVQK
jgi:Cell cycle protein